MRKPALLVTSIALLSCAQGEIHHGIDLGGGGADAPSPPRDVSNTVDAANVDAPSGQIDAPTSGCATPFLGTLATWSFASGTGSQAATAAVTMATGVTASSFTRSATLTAASGAGSMNSTNWSTSTTLAKTTYYTLTVTPAAGCALKLTSLAIDAKASATGPAMAVVATDADSFVQTATVSTSATSTPTLSVTSATSPVEIRIFGYDATSSSGTMRVTGTLTLTGAIE